MKFNPYFYLFLCLFLSFSFCVQSQNIVPAKKATMNIGLAQYISQNPNSTKLTDILVEGNSNDISSSIETAEGRIKFSFGNIYAVRIPLNKIHLLLQSASVKRIEAMHSSGTLLDSETDTNANIYPVKNGNLPLTQSYDGSGVVIGIIDDGIDLSHPDFKDAQGHTRVKYLWSQTDSAGGTTPSYGYGQEWDSAAIDAGCSYVPTTADYGHGSTVAGCAAGNGLAVNNYYGVATNADLIFVAADMSKNFLAKVVDATDYIYAKAAELGKPCVINASLGSYSGSHDGTDLPAKLIDALISKQNGRAFVCAAGNAGNILLHLGYPVQKDSLFTWFKYEPSISRVYFEVWANKSAFDSVSFAIGADKSPSPYAFRGRTPYYNILSNFNFSAGIDTVTDTLWSGNTVLGAVEILAEKSDTTYHLGISIFTDSTAYNWRFITYGSGYFDIWSHPNYTGTSNIVKANLPSSAAFPDIVRYVRPDKTQNIVSSFTCSEKTIAVANYNNKVKWLDVNNVLQTPETYTAPPSIDTVAGEIASSSSIGPARNGKMKPDISAPGNFTFASGLLSLMPAFISSSPGKVGIGGKHILNGGTSMASPVVAGIVALYLQKRPDASWQEIKDAILNTAQQDTFTSAIVPNTYWGYGKVDAFAALNYFGCKDMDAVNYNPLAIIDDGSCDYNTSTGILISDHSLSNYPNPFNDYTTIYYQTNPSFHSVTFTVTDVAGRAVASWSAESNRGNIIFTRQSLPGGIYFCKMIADGKMTVTKKLVIF